MVFSPGYSGVSQPQSILQSEIWQNPNLWRFWSWCQLVAVQEPTTVFKRYKPVTLFPGQFIFNRRTATLETGLSEQTLRTCVKTLSSGDNPYLTVTPTHNYTILTLRKSGGYSDAKIPANPAPTQSQPTPNPAPTQLITGLPSETSLSSLRAYAPAPNVVINNNLQPTATLPPELLKFATTILEKDCEYLLLNWLKIFPEEWIILALSKCYAKELKKREASYYALGILREWRKKGGPENDELVNTKNYGSPRPDRPKGADQLDLAQIMESRRRGAEWAAGMGNPYAGFTRCSG